jgi:DNA-binding transcriptional MerR regulator
VPRSPPKPKPDTSPATGLTAAECARRTGLTVRALRVYERHRLIKPPRSANGWRLYGPAELVRLNAIVALRNLGMTLAQIRKALQASPPDLAEALDLQLRTWATRRVAAERATVLIQSALARLRTRAALSLDELCELLRSAEMTDMQAITRELINQHITPEQEREWLTYWARRKPEEIAASQEQRAAFRAISEEFRELMRSGLPASSPEAQRLVERSGRLWVEGGLRERQLEQLSWNPEVTRAWFKLGGKLLARSVIPESADEAEQLRRYVLEARRSSKAAQVFTPLVIEARRLRDLGAPLESADARALGKRFVTACGELGVGDASVHARWIAAFGEIDDPTREAWEYLSHLV